MQKIFILGIGDEGLCGLTEHCRSILDSAELVIAASTTINQINHPDAELITMKDDLEEVVAIIQENRSRKIVILSLGACPPHLNAEEPW